VIRPLLLVGLAAFCIAGCNKSGGEAASSDPYAGLDKEIVGWRDNLEARHPACATKVDGKGCVGFEVTCKAQQTITTAETAGGTSARVVAAMTFTGGGGGGSPGSAFAVFTKTGGAWTRVETKPVNLGTCAPA
jgi:hypothetical protein